MQTQDPFGTGTPVPPPPPQKGQAIEQVKLPAIFLIVMGALGVLGALVSMVGGAFGGNEEQLAEMMNDPNFPEGMRPLLEMSGPIGTVVNVVNLAISGIVLFGAISMLKLQRYGLAMGASILAVIPCVGPCVCLAIPFGIWSLVVLSKSEVKQAFAS